MRVGDFSLRIIAANGVAVELESGHVLARPGQVYSLRLHNHSRFRAVVDVSLDGHRVTGNGLVLDAFGIVNLERPIHASERGRFTVIAEGDEHVFGPDGGRDNPELGLIEARFRRELPPPMPMALLDRPFPDQPHGYIPPRAIFSRPDLSDRMSSLGALDAVESPTTPADAPASPTQVSDAIERAAGTGLTGSSDQEFVTTHVGPLESQATVIQLRLVIGTEDALTGARPLPGSVTAPARPKARP